MREYSDTIIGKLAEKLIADKELNQIIAQRDLEMIELLDDEEWLWAKNAEIRELITKRKLINSGIDIKYQEAKTNKELIDKWVEVLLVIIKNENITN